MPRLRAVGLRRRPTVLDALAEDGLCEHGRGGRAVTATSEVLEATSRPSARPCFRVDRGVSISFATVTPSLVMIGAPNFFSITALRPLGPMGNLHCVGKNVHTTQNRLAEFSPVTICFAILVILLIFCSISLRYFRRLRPGVTSERQDYLLAAFAAPLSFAKNFFFAKDEKFLVLRV